MPQFEAYELYTVSDDFLTDVHNQGGCVGCHGGTPGVNVKEDSHAGFIDDPSEFDIENCAACHREIVENHSKSLMFDQTGYKTALLARSGAGELTSDMRQMLDERCAECHTTCGQCHVSQPKIVNGGLLDKHEFKKTPNLTRNCTACHGQSLGKEFRGEIRGIKASIHYLAGMTCTDCHTGDELHGANNAADKLYNAPARPSCRDCHGESINDANPFHEQHIGQLECHVCHAQPYTNCYQCHVARPGSGATSGTLVASEIDFRIGRNPLKSDERPEEICLLRHGPVYPDSFEDYGIELEQFASEPTWGLATPHNIQRFTPQNASCDSCHGHSSLFLTEFYINMKINQGRMFEEEIDANKDVIVDEVP